MGKMADEKWHVFSSAVHHSLENFPALKIAQQHGFGGENTKEKMEWFSGAVLQIFQDNSHVYPDELEDFISEVLYNEFDTMVEDGTLPKLAERICTYHNWCSCGQTERVIEEVRVLASQSFSVVQKLEDDNSDNEQEASQPAATSSSAAADSNSLHSGSCNQCNETPNIEGGDASMEVDNSGPMETEDGEDNDGWEVVRRSKKKKR